MKLDVRGQENLWKSRPAIFMFNHQSNADMLVMASLIRRDIVGIGKRELKNLPVIGPLMGASGVVFIDRSNREAAINAMAPVVKTMKEEGKSLVLAPEGTRAPTRKLGAFKKAASISPSNRVSPLFRSSSTTLATSRPRGPSLSQWHGACRCFTKH